MTATSGYRNPVLPGFYPDPSVCRVGDEYFLVTSTFTWFPGIPVFRSTDLVDWHQIGHVLDRPSQLDLSASQGWASMGIYAPTIRHHDGRFFVIVQNVLTTGGETIYMTAEDPAGPWSDPVRIHRDGGDPDLTWDADGTCWVHVAAFDHIERFRIDDTTGEILSEPERTWSGTGGQYPEAPHVFERDGDWYLLLAEGGTRHGHAVSIARGSSPAGPWESCPHNPVLTHRGTGRPIQNVGHGDLVEAPDGSWWLVVLGVRPRGVSPAFHVLGRETFLAPVEWVDGWPVIAPLELEVSTRPPGDPDPVEWTGRDDFDGDAPGPCWIAVRRSPGEFASTTDRPGWLTLHGTEASLDAEYPVLLGRRQQHHLCRARTLLDRGTAAEAGLTVYDDELSHYRVAVVGDRVVASGRTGPFRTEFGAAPAPDGPVVLRVETAKGLHGPDTVRLGFEDGAGTFRVLAELDGRYLSTEVTGGFVGRVLGLYAVGGAAAFDWFDYQEADGSR
ncbi:MULTISPECIES: glycoside hydrolase family 43 protein [unclassified Blastococcus]